MTGLDARRDPVLTNALASTERRLRQWFPTVPRELIQRSIERAALEYAGASVRGFLHILIELRASDDLRALPTSGASIANSIEEEIERRPRQTLAT